MFHAPSQKAYSYYPDDEFQHFYRWSSAPGIMKIMAVLIIVMCVAIFACVASTLAWDTQGALASYGVGYGSYGSYGGGYGAGYGTFGGAGYGPANNYGYGSVGGNYNDPRTAKGFIIAMAGIIFITCLVFFIIVVSHQSLSESRRFYLAMLIICALLAPLMLIAAIVYLMAVNPMAQSNGSMYAMQIQGLCAPYQVPQGSALMNQYLYHYCVLEPQEAIAAVLGFLVAAALIVMLVFALKTRKKIQNYGKSNILWKKVKVIDDMAPPPDVEEWDPTDLEKTEHCENPENKLSHINQKIPEYGKVI